MAGAVVTTEAPPKASSDPPPSGPAGTAPATSGRQFWAAVGLGLLFIALVNLAIRHTELVAGRYVSGGVPPVAAFAALLLLLGLRTVLRRLPPPFRSDLTREQLLLVYSMVALGTFLAGAYAVRAFLPHLLSLQYWSRTRAELAPFVQYVPGWFSPTEPEAIRQYFEGNHGAGIPWRLWLAPLAAWLAFWVAMFGAGWCLLLLFRRQWIEHERLSFPLLALPLALTGNDARFGSRPLLRNPILWFGIAAGALFDAVNIAHVFWPMVAAPGFHFPFTGLFTERAQEPLNSIALFFMPEGVGFGYFLPLEVSFSTWFFYLLEKGFAVAALSAGWQAPGLPFYQEQSAGAILAIATLLLAGNAGGLWRGWRAAFRRAPGRGAAPAEPGERGRVGEAAGAARETRLAWIGLALCSAVLLWFCAVAGMAPRVALLYLAILAGFMLVYARLRAETGAPYEFVYPYGMPKELVLQAFSVQGILDVGGPRTMVMLSAFAWLSRHHPGHMAAADSVDALKLAQVTGSTRGRFFTALLCALVFGFLAATWSHLSAYYDMGSNLAGGGNGRGEFRAQVAVQEYGAMAEKVAAVPFRDGTRLTSMGAGAGIAFLLSGLRRVWFGSPFHPLGFVLGTAYGDSTIFFFPLLVASLCKWTLLHAGGLRLYREGTPFFIGLIVGHFSVAGIFWPVLSLFIGRDLSEGYQVYFG
jgi:hypothetical protein